MPPSQFQSTLVACCGSRTWVSQLSDARPFEGLDRLMHHAESIWWNLGPEDWLEAFSKHPKIGGAGQLSKWSSEEQRGMNAADAETAQNLARLNQAYFEKFGWIYIVCATGKCASEMLKTLEERMSNEEQPELRIAAGEQCKIMRLRIAKLLSE